MKRTEYIIRTVDRWRLSLIRLNQGSTNKKPPLILIHGLGQNRYTWDEPTSQFARWFAENGIDVWIVELRGSGQSKNQKMDYAWSVDDYINKDMPAVTNFILKKTEKNKVFLCGHSLGGCIIYAFLPYYEKRIAGFISIAGPLSYSLNYLGGFVKIASYLNHIPYLFFKKTAVEFMPNFYLPVLGMLAIAGYSFMNSPLENLIPLHPWHRKNVEMLKIIIRIYKGFEPVSPKVVAQLLNLAKTGKLTSYDKKTNYWEGFKKAKVPGLFIAGSKDRLAPPSSVKNAYNLYEFTDKKYILMNKAEHRVHWGHLDLTMGRYAPIVLYPLIFNWMSERS